MNVWRVVMAKTKEGLADATPKGERWGVDQDTVRQFTGIDFNDDHSLGDLGEGVSCSKEGFVALARREI